MINQTGTTGRARGAAPRVRSSANKKVIYYDAYTGDRSEYIQGSVATDPFWMEDLEEERHRRVTETTIAARKNRENASSMSVRTMGILGVLIAMVTLSLIFYIRLFSEISSTDREVASLRTELATLRSANDETYNEITNNIDLETVRKKAINEFGMKYAGEDQIVEYSNAQNGSVHQVADISR